MKMKDIDPGEFFVNTLIYFILMSIFQMLFSTILLGHTEWDPGILAALSFWNAYIFTEDKEKKRYRSYRRYRRR